MTESRIFSPAAIGQQFITLWAGSASTALLLADFSVVLTGSNSNVWPFSRLFSFSPHELDRRLDIDHP